MTFLQTAIQAAIEAGQEILKIYDTGFEVQTKNDDSPLTLADLNANRVINDYLKKTDIPIISEENKQIDYGERKSWNSCWIVDPLDGTKEFIKRNGEFTVNIALIEGNMPKLGVIYVPVTKKLYYADVNVKKAYMTELIEPHFSIDDLLSEEHRIFPSKDTPDIARVVGSRSHMTEDTMTYIAELEKKYQKVEIVSKGSSLKFCLVAEGNADFYPRFAPTMEWDTAAGQAICEAVGLKVIDQQTKSPLKYNRENLLNNYFLVSR